MKSFALYGDMSCTRKWHSKLPPFRCLDVLLRGVGQVVFANNPLSGVLVLAGLFIYDPWIAFLGTLALMTASLSAKLLNTDSGMLNDGLFGFNALLAGQAIGVFLIGDGNNAKDQTAVILIVCTFMGLFTVSICLNLSRSMGRGVPYLTLPFNIAVMFFLAGCYQYDNMNLHGSLQPHLPVPNEIVGSNVTAHKSCMRLLMDGPCAENNTDVIFGAALRGIGQVFFCDDPYTGAFILAGILLADFKTGVLGALASLGGVLAAISLGVDGYVLYHGIWGYNACLSAMAIPTFLEWNSASVPVVAFTVISTVLLQGSLSSILGVFGLPVLTLPFCGATTLLLRCHGTSPYIRLKGLPEKHAELVDELPSTSLVSRREGTGASGLDQQASLVSPGLIDSSV